MHSLFEKLRGKGHKHGHWHGIGRHRRHGGHGFGHFMAGFTGEGGLGGRNFRTGRKLGSDDLQLLILSLLAEKPSHGYEIIKMLEERSGGFYSPSPGMVYPALTYLEEIGHASVESEGTKKLYRITDAGRVYLDANRAAAEAMLEQLSWVGRKMDHVRRAFSGDESMGDDRTGDDDGEFRASRAELRAARRELRAALLAKRDASEEEQRRVAEILKRATGEIRGS